MRDLCFLLSGLFLLTSCSPHFVTRGIKDKTSNYVITSDGKKITARSLSFDNNAARADSTTFRLKSISGIKDGQAYFGVKNGVIYDGVYYGKLIILQRYMGYTINYSPTNHSQTPNYSYYIQKEGQPEILDFTGKNLVESVRDNPLALRKARSARIFSTISITTAATTIVGLGCVFLPYSSKIRDPAVTIGLYSLPTFLITLPIAAHKKYKTVIVYDR
ncbi:MAG TPA: hypothetical protein VG367_12760 [Mucilaginibacter sp.]|jgi:hypothetical protein|nr:hypothetical protein [Mucilaginibacter sp.]